MTVAASAGLFIGRYVLGDEWSAVFATFTAIALLGLADFGGPLRIRARAYVGATVCGIVLVALGTMVSQATLWAAASLFVVVFVVMFAGVLGRNIAAGGLAVTLFYVVASGVPGAVSTIPGRLSGVLLGGILSLLAGLLMWPERPSINLRTRLADALDELSHAVGLLASGKQLSSKVCRSPEVKATKAYLNALAERPSQPTMIDGALVSMVHGTRYAAKIIDQLAVSTKGANAKLANISLGGLQATPRTITNIAALLRANQPGKANNLDPKDLFADHQKYVRSALRAFTSQLKAGASVKSLETGQHAEFLVSELTTLVAVLAADARVVRGIDKRPSAAALEHAPVRGVSYARPVRQKIFDRLKLNFRTDSVMLRNALRLALGLAIARLVAGQLHLGHEFWVVFAAMSVMRGSASATRSTSVQAVLGTAIGFGLAVGILLVTGHWHIDLGLLVPPLLFLAFYVGILGFVASQAGFTMVVIVLFDFLATSSWSLGLVRLEDVAIGAAVSTIIALAVWPKGATGELAKVTAKAVRAASAYAIMTSARLLVGARLTGTDIMARRHAIGAALLAEDVYVAYAGEAASPEAVADWSRTLALTHRLWFMADLISGLKPAQPSSLCRHLAAELNVTANGLRHGYAVAVDELADLSGQLGDANRIKDTGKAHSKWQNNDSAVEHEITNCLIAVEAGGDADDYKSVVGLLFLRCWLGELDRIVDNITQTARAIKTKAAS